MTEESPRKRARLCEDEGESPCKPDLQEQIKKQEEYIAELEARLETSGPSNSSSGDGEDKVRHLKAARREQLLVMRLTTKEQELHDLANQLADKTQNASTAQLRSATIDPALNLLIQRLKKELEDKTTSLKQAHEDMSAWKFTPDSQTGKRLMARCRTLIQENQELGKQVSQGKVAQLEEELTVQKGINEELRNSQEEMYEMVIQLNDEGEGMQSTILALQQELKEKQLEIARLTCAVESAGIVLTPNTTADLKHESQNEDNGEQSREESMPNMQVVVTPASMQDNTAGKHVEPYKEITDREEEAVKTQIPDVRTTEYSDEETPMDTASAPEAGQMENSKSLSVDPWYNPSHFVESPASPVEEEDDMRTPENPIIAVDDDHKEFSTGAQYQESSHKPAFATEDKEIPKCEEREIPKYEERENPKFEGGENPKFGGREKSEYGDGENDQHGEKKYDDKKATQFQEIESAATPDTIDQQLINERPTMQEQSRHYREIEKEEFEGDEGEEEEEVRTPPEESSQCSLPSEDVPENDVISSRTGSVSFQGEGSGTVTPDFSTNGEEIPLEPTNQNNGQESDIGRLGESENYNENGSSINTLVKDPSTFQTAIEIRNSSLDDESDMRSDITDKQSDFTDKQSDLTDKQSDLTDKQSDITDQQSDTTEPTTNDNNNGLSNPGEGVDSSASSPQAEQNCAPDGEFVRTDNVIKSLNSNSYSNSPDEKMQSERCDEITSTTNSNNPEEISV